MVDPTPKRVSNKLQATRSALFEQGLQLLLCLYPAELNPLASAIGICLFSQIGDDKALEAIYRQLDQYVGLANQDPTVETDIPNKTLLLVSYHGLCQIKSYEEHLPLAIVNRYLSYANSEVWFRSASLALFVHEFARDMQVVESTEDYFRSAFKSAIDKGHIALSCQSLRVLPVSAADSQTLAVIDLIESQPVEKLSVDDLAWMLIGLTSLPMQTQGGLPRSRVNKLVDQVEAELSQRIKPAILRDDADIWFHGIMYLIQSGVTSEEIEQFAKRIRSYGTSGINGIRVNGSDVCIEVNEDILSRSDYLSVSSLALSLWALYLSGRHQMVGVPSNLRDDLSQIVERGEKALKTRAVIMSRRNSIIVSILALIFVVVVGLSLSIFVGGAKFVIDMSSFQPNNLDILTVLFPTLVVLILGLIAIVYTGTVLPALQDLPFMKAIRTAMALIRRQKSGDRHE